MLQNGIYLENLTVHKLKDLISETVAEQLQNFTPPTKEQTEYLTRADVKQELKISFPTLNEYTKKGILKGYRIGGRVLYKRAEVENSLKEIQTIKYRRIWPWENVQTIYQITKD